jgi:hypothetical protein
MPLSGEVNWVMHGTLHSRNNILQSERTRHTHGSSHTRIPFRSGERQVAWIDRHRKIRAAAFFVGGIDNRI